MSFAIRGIATAIRTDLPMAIIIIFIPAGKSMGLGFSTVAAVITALFPMVICIIMRNHVAVITATTPRRTHDIAV